ncbi:MAG: PD-(D/E)XK nuclease family protein [Chloroflexi bacterium]|nr:PD-(D/E)XK nuclease family protein [Chloroflexota bacterium]
MSRTVTPALNLPETFAFSQSSLQAYEDCPRRFWLAYAEQLPWPAVEAEPVSEHEQLMRLGSTFHLLVQRAQIGLDPELLGAGLEPPLGDWFNAYLHHRPTDLPSDFFEVERILSMPFGVAATPLNGSGHAMAQTTPIYRLAAKYDLIAADQTGRVVIIDWKTARKRTDPANLRQRLQTIVYPYVLVEASAKLPWGPVQPEQVEMRYWFTAAPGQPVVFRYDRAQHEANHERLHHLLEEILAGQREVDFPTVYDTEINRKRFCSFCVYRSRCNRGVTAGNLDELADAEDFFAVDADTALEFTLDDVTELAF